MAPFIQQVNPLVGHHSADRNNGLIQSAFRLQLEAYGIHTAFRNAVDIGEFRRHPIKAGEKVPR